jgi:hypothetical protein
MSSVILRAFLASVLFLSFSLAMVSCETYRTRKVVFKNHPIALYVISELVDEETIDYSVKFRNVGREVLSFDYTIADEAGVPHVDAEGPNSGVIENLYPGAEVKVENPTDSMKVFVTLGKVTYGKRPAAEIKGIYSPSQFEVMEGMSGAGTVDAGLIPLPSGPNPSL